MSIDGVEMDVGLFDTGGNEVKSGHAGGLKWSTHHIGGNAKLGFEDMWVDSKHDVTVSSFVGQQLRSPLNIL